MIHTHYYIINYKWCTSDNHYAKAFKLALECWSTPIKTDIITVSWEVAKNFEPLSSYFCGICFYDTILTDMTDYWYEYLNQSI